MRKRDLILLAAALITAIALTIHVVNSGVMSTISWGLQFDTPGTPPKGPASPAALARYGGAYRGDPEEKVIYLTFDAGYENGHTGKILDTLKKHHAPAVFFVVGHYVEKNPDLLKRMLSEGHTLGNHTMHHPDMSKISEKAAFQKELQELETLYKKVTGQELSRFYRPPQGIYTENNLKMAKELGYRTVFWSLAYADWDTKAQPSREAALGKLIPRIHNGAVVLLHSTSATNAAILDELLTKWEEMGYRFAPISHLFEGHKNTGSV